MPRRVRLRHGLAVAYAEWGNPSGEPVVLLHGYADSHRFFEPVVEHLVAEHRVLALTQRGHGDSDKPLDGYDLTTLADDVLSFLDALGLDHAVLVGHSSGGLVAEKAALAHPGRVAGLVLVGVPPDLRGVVAPFADIVAAMEDPVPMADVRAVLGTLDVDRLAVTAAYVEEMVGESAKVPAAVWRKALAELTSAEPPAAHGVPAVPAVVVWGDGDPVLAREGQEQLAAAWGAELVVLHGGGHLLAWEQPERVAQTIDRFLVEHASDGRS